MTTIDIPNQSNSKASELPISVSKRKLSNEMTQQQPSKKGMIENALLTCQPRLDATASTEPQHCRISNWLLEIRSFKPPTSCSTLRSYKIVHSDM